MKKDRAFENLTKKCLRTLRILCGYSINEFADILDITYQTYISYEVHDKPLTRMQCYAILYVVNKLPTSNAYYAKRLAKEIENLNEIACDAVVDFVNEKHSTMCRRNGIFSFYTNLTSKYSKELAMALDKR
jgi:DNA-binding XRE family transcriptional regulator